MNEIAGTLIVAVVLVIIVGLVICKMVRDRKRGKSIQCGGECAKCSRGCH